MIRRVGGHLNMGLPDGFNNSITDRTMLLLFIPAERSRRQSSMIEEGTPDRPTFPSYLNLILKKSTIYVQNRGSLNILILRLIGSDFGTLRSNLTSTRLLVRHGNNTRARSLSSHLSNVIRFNLGQFFRNSAPPRVVRAQQRPRPSRLETST